MDTVVTDYKKKIQSPGFEEGKVAKKIENVTAKVPSDVYLWAAVGAMGVSLALQLTPLKKTSLFIGQWAPSILIMGIYNKLVKVQEQVTEKVQGGTQMQGSMI